MKELWLPVKDYEGYYDVSNLGRVRSTDRIITYPDGHTQFHKGKILSPHETKWGYLLVGLCKNGRKTRKHVHDLVSAAFIPNPDNLSEVNHKNHNKHDNCVSNLEWVTHKENMVDMGSYKIHNNPRRICPICNAVKVLNANCCKDCYLKIKTSKSISPSKRRFI